MTPKRWLALIVVAYLVLATIYSVVTPIFEASDELWHYPMVKYVADSGFQLPVLDANHVGPWRQEGGQPPLYYLLGAALTRGIDTSDMDFVRRVNPHADIGVVRPDGNANMITHRVAAEAFPWQGTVLAVHLVRLLSVALGALTVIVSYLLASEVFPNWPLVAVGAAALNAFLPMFLFISGSVNNDNLSNLLGNLLTLLIVRLLKAQIRPHWTTYIILGVVTGAALLSKLNVGFLIPLIALALLIVSLRLRDGRPLLVGGIISGALTIAIAGWWYLRNEQLYGDPTGLSAFLSVVGRRAVPANAAQLWAERSSFTQAYWGFFGGVNVPLPEWAYLTLNLIGGFALISAVVYLTVTVARRSRGMVSPLWLPALVTLIWPVITFVSYLRWTAETPASQGRLIFGALSSISLWMAVGLAWWLPRRLRPVLLTGASAFLFTIAATAPFAVIAPAYAPPNPAQVTTAPLATFSGDDGALALLDAQIITPSVRPDDYAKIEIDWRVQTKFSQDWSLFVHLTTVDGVIVAQRDIYPGGGLLATSDLSAGYAWVNPVAIRLPPTAYAPETLDVEVGWYNLATLARLRLPDGSETEKIGQVQVVPRASALGVPNPISINFDHQVELVGYAMNTLTPKPGSDLMLTFYWRTLGTVTKNYTVFTHVIDPRSATQYAGSDSQPVNGQAPTSTWKPGAIIEDTHILKLQTRTPPGIYEVEMGLYSAEADGSFPRLRIITADGGMADNFLYLNRIRVPLANGN